MLVLAKRLKARIGEDKTLILHVPDMPQGESRRHYFKKRRGLS